MPELVPLGDRAWLARFSTEIDARNWAETARRAKLPQIIDIVLAYKSVSIHLDPSITDFRGLETRLRALEPAKKAMKAGRLVTLPVLYDGDDLPEVAEQTGLTIDQVVALHCSMIYDVFAIGFQPGFPYAGYLPPPLDQLPRRGEPRVRVPAGSVAIAARQTGVYPAELPGGWNLIGRTPLTIVDVANGHFPIAAGDRLQFAAINADEFSAQLGNMLT